MYRRSIHRWIAVLALAATLALAGARPAAAVDLRLADRLASLWSTVTAGGPAALWDALTSLLGGNEKSGSSDATTDASKGSDPNGLALNSDQPIQPVAPSGSH